MRSFLTIAALFTALTLVVVLFLMSSPHVQAQSADLGLSEFSYSQSGLPAQTPAQYVSTIIRWVLGIIGVILVALIVYGGVMYATSAGNESRVDTAKRILTYAIIGVVITFAAFIISSFVISALAPQPTTSTGANATLQERIQRAQNVVGSSSAPAASGNDCFVNDQNQTCCRTSTGVNYTCYNRAARNTDKCYVDSQQQLCCPNVFGRIRCSQ